MKRLAALLLLAAGCAGCGSSAGGGTSPPGSPRLPRALAQGWAKRADAIAQAASAGDGCGARRLASALRGDVVRSVNAGRIPQPLLEPLVSAVNDLAERIACAPAASPSRTSSGGPARPKPPPGPGPGRHEGRSKRGKHDKPGKHGGHGRGGD